MPVHGQTEQVEGAVVEAEIPAYAVKRFARRKDTRFSLKALHRTPIKVIAAQLQIGVIARSARPRRLNLVPAGRILLQVEPVLEAPVEVLKVGIGERTDDRANVPARAGRTIRIRALVDDGQRVVITAVVVAAADFHALRR